jgi:hypothetical protein
MSKSTASLPMVVDSPPECQPLQIIQIGRQAHLPNFRASLPEFFGVR